MITEEVANELWRELLLSGNWRHLVKHRVWNLAYRGPLLIRSLSDCEPVMMDTATFRLKLSRAVYAHMDEKRFFFEVECNSFIVHPKEVFHVMPLAYQSILRY